MSSAEHIHTIPVPDGMTPEQAWVEICTLGSLIEPDGACSWTNVECDGQECEGAEWDRGDS